MRAIDMYLYSIMFIFGNKKPIQPGSSGEFWGVPKTREFWRVPKSFKGRTFRAPRMIV